MAVIIASPLDFNVTTPFESTVATLVLFDVQFTPLPSSAVVFTLRFTVSPTAPVSSFPFDIPKSTLTDTDAPNCAANLSGV